MAPKALRRMDTAGLPDDFQMSSKRCGFGISWDRRQGAPAVDMDLQCVIVDNKGSIIDCAYYNNLKAANAVTHSGDEPTGAAEGIDELVWVNTTKLADSVALMIFVVAAYSGGCLRDVVNGKLHVFEETKTRETARFEMERSEGCVDVVAALFRTSAEAGGWTLRIIDEPAREGQHFMDILPFLGQVIRGFIPDAPKRHKVAFAMDKGGVLDLPRSMQSITVGLGWDTDEGECDLDVSAVLLNERGQEVETVFFGNLESDKHGITHSGDNQTGDGDGDDEKIVAVLDQIGSEVQQIVFVINVYTPKKSFRDVAAPFCRVLDNASATELCRYSLREAGTENGLVVSRLAREAGGRWGFHALGIPCRGRTYKDSLRQITEICGIATKTLLERSESDEISRVGGFATSAPSAPPAIVKPPAAPAAVPFAAAPVAAAPVRVAVPVEAYPAAIMKPAAPGVVHTVVVRPPAAPYSGGGYTTTTTTRPPTIMQRIWG
eukprot:TRINITY_DN4541_c0_g1_i1.p1 TRINITY_DN4541_c0_g1~~TRINITY_DN4541_c0_g1_i1.p1  ORF type:complete len:491 (+),score=64.42 TRINITY_DN4541_c0_g1_i1:124-1596(+)